MPFRFQPRGPAPKSTPPKRTTTITDPERVLLIAPNTDDTARVLGELDTVTDGQLEVEWVTELSTGIERLGDAGVGAAVLDLNVPGSQGTEKVDQVIQAALDVPVLILSERDTEASAQQAVQRGAQDYLVKDNADGYRLRRTVRSMMDRRAWKEAALENEIANATLNSIEAAIMRVDLRGNLTYLNRFAERITGWYREDAIGRPVTEVLRLIDSASGATVDNGVASVLQIDGLEVDTICTINCTLVRQDGAQFGIVSRVTIVDDDAGNVIGIAMVITDVTVSLAASLEVSRVAQLDSLTHLPNRTLFQDRLRQAISLAQRQRKALAVLFVDLNTAS
jgi:PAS domain S-box-containing protein